MCHFDGALDDGHGHFKLEHEHRRTFDERRVGVEVGGAVKNVLAIATGLCDGLSLGLNARAALITRGLAEMTRFGLALGARAETFHAREGLATSGFPSARDASFPSRDTVDVLAALGLTRIIPPAGSKRDDESIQACNEHGIAMVFTGARHFRH